MTNIAEILKDAPKGLELYSQLLGNVYVDKIINYGIYRIQVIDTNKDMRWFMQDGRYINYLDEAECILFPSKEHKSWDNWQEVLFKVGDIVTNIKNIEQEQKTFIISSKSLNFIGTTNSKHELFLQREPSSYRYATPEEREQFFKELNRNGYTWNNKAKQMEKSLQTNTHEYNHLGCVYTKTKEKPFTIDDFKPFDMVLVKYNTDSKWTIELFEQYDKSQMDTGEYICLSSSCKYCIPYNDETKHLLGTADDCPDKYKTW